MTIPPGRSKENPVSDEKTPKKPLTESNETAVDTIPVTKSSEKLDTVPVTESTEKETANGSGSSPEKNVVQTIATVSAISPNNTDKTDAKVVETKDPLPNPDTTAIATASDTPKFPATRDNIVPAPEIGPGWKALVNFRKATPKRAAHTYKHYLSPKNKYRLHSRVIVDRFMAALETFDGDETKAYGNIKTKPNKDDAAHSKSSSSSSKTQQRVANYDEDDPPPKKPPVTYLMYTSKLRAKVMAEMPGKSPVEISKRLGEIWRALSVTEKEGLKKEYAKKLEEYKQNMKEWELRNPGRAKPEKKKRGRPSLSPKGKADSLASKKAKTTTKSKTKKTNKDSTKWWEVEGFRDRRVNKSTGKEEYLIKWKGCPESSNSWEPSSNLNLLDDAREWWRQETIRRKNLALRQKRIDESMKRLGLDGSSSSFDGDEIETGGTTTEGMPQEGASNEKAGLSITNMTMCRRNEAPPGSTKTTQAAASLVEDETWNWEDASQVNFRSIRRISVHDLDAREQVTEARITGTPVVLIGHVGWANFALRWLRRKDDGKDISSEAAATTADVETSVESIQKGDNATDTTTNNDNRGDAREEKNEQGRNSNGTEGVVIPMEVDNGEGNCTMKDNDISLKTSSAQKDDNSRAEILQGDTEQDGDPINATTTKINGQSSTSSAPASSASKDTVKETKQKEDKKPSNGESLNSDATDSGIRKEIINKSTTGADGSNKPLDLSDPSWYLDIEAMSKDIGDEEVPVVKKNYNESKPISGNIFASKFLEVGWKVKKEQSTPSKRKAILYLHQWQFPLSVEAGKKLCHQSAPLPNNILGEDLLKYWLDRVKLDSPLQYLFMGNADTMSRIHRDNGGLAISIAPITGEKECILVHRDDGHACLYNNQAPLDPDDIDLNAYPLLPHARIWKTVIKPGEILLMPHGTFHQCRNVTPCLSYSRFHLDGVNIRAFLHSMMDGDAPELHQDEVLWNATRELIDVVDKASDEKRPVDPELFKAVDALRALRNITKEVTRKLYVRETVKGTSPSSSVVSSSVNIDGDAEMWQSLVDDVDMCLHEFRYRFNNKIPSFKRRRSIGKKVLALPALPFRGKSKPSEKELNQGRNEPVVAFECPTDRGFLALPKAPSEISTVDREVVEKAVKSIVVGDDMVVRIEGKRCPARVTEVVENARAAWVSFEDLPSLYNDFIPCDLLRTPSVGGSCLAEPPPDDIKPGKLFVCLMGKDEYRGVVQHVKCGRFFKSKLDFGKGYSISRLIDPESILSVNGTPKMPVEKELKRRRVQKTQSAKIKEEEIPQNEASKEEVSDSNIPKSNTNPIFQSEHIVEF